MNKPLDRLAKGSIALGLAMAVSGCEVLHESEARRFAEKQVKGCGGIVTDFALVPSPKGKNLYEGLAKVNIDGETYELELEVTAGAKDSIIRTSDNPCAEHQLRKGIKDFLDIFK